MNNSVVPNLNPEQVLYYISYPIQALGAVYDIKDSVGNQMESPSIIQMTGQAYKYAAVYHTPYAVTGGWRYRVNLAASNDLIHWTFIRMLIDNADMPKIAQVTGAAWVVLVNERWLGTPAASTLPCQIQYSLFYDFNDLMNGVIRSTWIQPQFGGVLNGTPSIYNINLTMTNGYYEVNGQFGFHYNPSTATSRDLVASTTVMHLFNPIVATVGYPSDASIYNSKIPVAGNIGQRDTLATTTARYNIQEGNIGSAHPTNFANWRLYLYKFGDTLSYPSGNGSITPITPHTPKGSTSFGNPSVSIVNSPSGGHALVISYFIFTEGAGAGEAGSLLYYFNIP